MGERSLTGSTVSTESLQYLVGDFHTGYAAVRDAKPPYHVSDEIFLKISHYLGHLLLVFFVPFALVREVALQRNGTGPCGLERFEKLTDRATKLRDVELSTQPKHSGDAHAERRGEVSEVREPRHDGHVTRAKHLQQVGADLRLTRCRGRCRLFSSPSSSYR
jgi:hypothetical protein